jgi:hypothetical protein
MSEYNIQDLIKNAIGEKPVAVQSVFDDLMVAKVRDEISGKRVEVANSFASEEEQDELEAISDEELEAIADEELDDEEEVESDDESDEEAEVEIDDETEEDSEEEENGEDTETDS